MPTSAQAGVYSSVMHYLKAVKAAGTTDSAAVMKVMKETPINDFFAKNGKIREDGRMVHDMYLFEVKKPSESKGALGRLQAARDRARQRGVPVAGSVALSAGEEVASSLRSEAKPSAAAEAWIASSLRLAMTNSEKRPKTTRETSHERTT